MIDLPDWYAALPQAARLYQGEVILRCPVAKWKADVPDFADLQDSAEYQVADVVVMSQDCDLENDNVPTVILCPAERLHAYKEEWETGMRAQSQNPTPKAWRKTVEKISKGEVMNLALLNDLPEDFGSEKLVVDFKEVFSIPRAFLETLVQSRPSRVMLAPPYREHLSQSFARFFMRVGLPTPIDLDGA